MSFDWRTEELESDEKTRLAAGQTATAEPLFTRPKPKRKSNRLKRRAGNPAVIAVVLLLLAALGGLIFKQIDARAAEGRRRVEAEVLASHETLLRAARAEDVELFAVFLSGSDAEWTRAQKQLVLRGKFTDRSAFGLYSLNDDSTIITPTLTFTPDLRSAEVVTRQRYAVANSEAEETITLERTTIFRRGADRWLLSSPEPTFWGEMVTAEGRYVRLRYPSRDAVVAERLASDLNAVLSELCAGSAGRCLPLMVNLSTHSDDLAAYVNPALLLQGGEVTLPTPTLFGAPVDEAGYRALYREYAVRVVSAAVANYTGWACCEDALFYSELLEAQLYELGLRPWPVTTMNFERLIENPALVDRLWDGTTVAPRHSDIWPIHALADFLTREIEHVSILEMQRLLLAENTLSYWDWINRVTKGKYYSRNEFDRALLRYAVEHRTATSPPIPLPDQDLQLMCWVGDAPRPSLFRYELSSGALLHELELASIEAPVIAALPARDGVVVSGRSPGGAAQTPFVWRDGQVTEIAFAAAPQTDFVLTPPEPGRPPLLFFHDTPAASLRYALLPLESCVGGQTCWAQAIPGAPTLSPDNEHSLIALGGPGPQSEGQWQSILFLGDEQGRLGIPLGPGASPFWLDNDTFGYVVLQGEGRQSVVVRDVLAGVGATSPGGSPLVARTFYVSGAQQPEVKGGSASGAPDSADSPAVSEPRELLNTTDLENIPYLDPAADRTIDRVLLNPNAPQLFIITTNARQPGGLSYVIDYDLADRSMTARFSFNSAPADDRRHYDFSPDGRWLVVGEPRRSLAPFAGAAWELFLHGIGDLASLGLTLNQMIVNESLGPADWLIDWSADGRWLALTTNGYIRLVAPGENYTLPLILDDASCAAAVWVNNG